MRESSVPAAPLDASGHNRSGRLVVAWLLLLAGLGLSHAGGVVTNCTELAFERALAGGGLVSLNCTGTLVLTRTYLITTNTTVQDLNGSARIEGGGSNRLFTVHSNAQLNLLRLTLAKGLARGTNGLAGDPGENGRDGEPGQGGAIYVDGGTLSASNSVFTANHALGGDGGAGGEAASSSEAGGRGGQGGVAQGGAIFNRAGRLFLTQCTFTANSAAGGSGGSGGNGAAIQDGGDGGHGGGALGGAVYNSAGATAELALCVFGGNSVTGAVAGVAGTNAGVVRFSGRPGAAGPAHGGALAGERLALLLSACSFSTNRASGANGLSAPADAANASAAAGRPGGIATGGAVYLQGGNLTAANVDFFGNLTQAGSAGHGGHGAGFGDGGNGGDGADGQGGAVHLTGVDTAYLADCSFDQNAAYGGFAGFGALGSTAFALNGHDGSAGGGRGGALHADAASLVLERSTFDANQVVGAEGLEGLPGNAFTNGGQGNAGGAALGGAVYLEAGTLSATNATFYANLATGGTGGVGGDGSTEGLFGSDGGRGGTGGQAMGGAIFASAAAEASIVNCTFATNQLVGGTGGPGGAEGLPDLTKPGGTGATGATAGSAIHTSTPLQLKNSILAYGNSAGNVSGDVADAGGNLSTDGTPELSGSSFRGDPGLGPLGDYGGLTATALPSTNTLDRGVVSGAPPGDQRGFARSSTPDIGATELDGTAPTLGIQTDGAGVVVTWANLGAAPFTLQSAAAIPTTNWSAVATTPVNLGDRFAVTNATTQGRRFYRLTE